MLSISDLHTYYGDIHALKGISLTVGTGEIVTLIGANGAGKTTLLKTISNILVARQGRVVYQGQDLRRMPPHRLISLGIAHVPEGRRVFRDLTVAENLAMGAYYRRDKQGVADSYQRVCDLFPRLHERRHQEGGTLSGGEQQMLAIGRALMADPKLLMLDEPSMGLAPLLVENVFARIADINRQGTTVLLVEQNAFAALQLAHRGYVLETGSIVMEDTARALLGNDRVRQTYLGEEAS